MEQHEVKVTKQAGISWQDRSAIASYFIRSGDVVCDLGAGAATLRRFLPEDVEYHPVDIRPNTPDTWVADLNGDFELPPHRFTVFTAFGLVHFLNDPPGFVRKLAAAAPGRLLLLGGGRVMAAARASGCVQNLALVARLRKGEVCVGTLTYTEPATERSPMSDLVLSNAPARTFVRAKVERALRIVRNRGNSGKQCKRG
jgi:hypothetical protein